MEKYKFLKGKEKNDVCVVYFSIIFQEVLKKHVFGSKGFPGGSDHKEYACNAGDPGSTPGVGRSPGEGNGNPLQYSCLENPMDRGAW